MKKNIKKWVLMAALPLLSSSFIANAQASAKITFATEATYPPFESMSPSGKIVGFDADLVQAICKQWQQSCQLVNAPFASLIPGLKTGKYDVMIGGLAITPQREKVVSFTQSYYKDPVYLVSLKSHALKADAADLKNKTIGVQGGTSYQGFLEKFYPQVKIKTYTSNLNALLDLGVKRIDGVLIDKPVFIAWLQGQGKSQQQFYTTLAASNQQQAAYFGPGNAIAVAKNNKVLLHKLNQAITAMKKDGSLKKMQKKWFGHD